MRTDTRVVLALDETDGAKAMAVAQAVEGLVDAIKINWPLVLSTSPQTITDLAELADVICDFKIADIPNTNRLIVEQAVRLGASGVIVHGFTGSDSVKAAVDAAKGRDVYVVTEMSHPGGVEFTAPNADQLANLAVRCGASWDHRPGHPPRADQAPQADNWRPAHPLPGRWGARGEGLGRHTDGGGPRHSGEGDIRGFRPAGGSTFGGGRGQACPTLRVDVCLQVVNLTIQSASL